MSYAKPKRAPRKKMPSGLTVLGNQLEQADRWRQQYNPLRGLTIQRSVSLFESAQRGDYSDLQWTYRFIERRDEDLIALMERRGNALLQMDWNIKTIDEKTAQERGIPFDPHLAEDQAAALRLSYERIDNLYAAIEHVAMAAFREFAVCQFQDGENAVMPGEATHIECLNGWNVVRDGLAGDWYWNPEARQVTAQNLPQENRIDPRCCLIRQWPRPLDEIALLKFVRCNLSRKNWDAFVEIYGLPGWVVIMPPNVPAGKEAEYMSAARAIAEGQPGALPSGSDAKCADQPRGINPFRDHLQYLTEKLVLAGTGGLLTMITAPGSGTLAGSAHMEAFQIVARGEARKISELFQSQSDKPLLASRFPGKPTLAYFELAANEEQDVGEILDHAVKIKQAGGQVNWDEMSEKTGYTITTAPEPAPNPFSGGTSFTGSALRNRAPGLAFAPSPDALLKSVAVDLAPLRARFAAAIALPDAEIILALQKLRDDLPELLKQIGAAPAAAAQMAKDLQEALDAGMKSRKEPKP